MTNFLILILAITICFLTFGIQCDKTQPENSIRAVCAIIVSILFLCIYYGTKLNF